MKSESPSHGYNIEIKRRLYLYDMGVNQYHSWLYLLGISGNVKLLELINQLYLQFKTKVWKLLTRCPWLDLWLDSLFSLLSSRHICCMLFSLFGRAIWPNFSSFLIIIIMMIKTQEKWPKNHLISVKNTYRHSSNNTPSWYLKSNQIKS